MNAKNEPRPRDFKPKLYYAMESEDNGKGLNKGKGIYRGNFEEEAKSNNSAEIKSLDKSRNINRAVQPFSGSFAEHQGTGNTLELPFAT